MLSFDNCFEGVAIDFDTTQFKYVKRKLPKSSNNTPSEEHKRPESGEEEADYFIFGTYAAATGANYSYRDDVGAFINMPLSGKEWNWHHVVEKTHLEPLYNPAHVELIHKSHMPCVLIHTSEHTLYNSLLHTLSTKAVYTFPEKGGSPLMGRDKEKYKNMLFDLYMHTYHDDVLKTVFKNILKAL